MTTTDYQAYTKGRRAALTTGVGLIFVVVLTVIASTADIRLAIIPPAAFVAVTILRWFGVGRVIPREPLGWFYAITIFITCWAPSLGTAGTVARTVLAGIALVLLVCISLGKTNAPLPKSVSIGAAILIFSLLAAAISAPSAGFAVARLFNWVMFIPLLWLAYRRPNVQGIVFGVVTTCIFQMFGVALQMLGLMGGEWGGLLTSGTTYDPEISSWMTRYTGFIWNPNNLALILAIGVIILAASLLAKVPARLKLFAVLLMAVFVYGIILTGSRGGIVAVALGLAVLFMAAGFKGVALAVVAVGVALILIQTNASTDMDRLFKSFAEIITGADKSAAKRSALWLDRSSQDGNVFTFLLGNGFGGYAPNLFAGQQGLDIDPALARKGTVDNSWLKMFLECGVIGAIGLAMTFLGPIRRAVFAAPGERRIWGIAAGAVAVALLWRSLSVDMLDQNPWNAILFLTIGIASASFKGAQSKPLKEKPALTRKPLPAGRSHRT